ncbi:AAA family ATPase [Tenacibaculum sp. 190130A14a]|uniref:AAA family ATPase n=1 Tax=Tenacibaculum polynesiense TaxID=3137857 RepID=UPI0032B1ED25
MKRNTNYYNPSYSGKGTQCEILKRELNFNHIPTGDRYRLEKENQHINKFDSHCFLFV